MTMYKDFVHDYPARCIDVLTNLFEHAKTRDREVTLLLMAAAGGFVMPYERLNKGQLIKQPDLDRPAHKKQMANLNEELNKKIKNSNIFRDIISKWRYSVLKEQHDTISVIMVAESAKPVNFEKKVLTAIKIIRHSIAHGNILAIESPTGEIQDLIFISRDGNPDVESFELIVLTPEDLEHFLLKWFEFIKNLKQQDVFEVFDSIAV